MIYIKAIKSWPLEGTILHNDLYKIKSYRIGPLREHYSMICMKAIVLTP